MMYLRWLLLAPVSLIFNLFCIVTSPAWALVAASFKLTKLPGCMSWVHTHDDWIYGFFAEKPTPPARFRDRWKAACRWIVRNPGYGFDAFVLGYPGPITFEGENNWQDYKFDTGQSVTRFARMKTASGRRFFSYRRDIALGRGRYIKLWVDWQTRNQAGRHMYKIDFNPFKKADD